MPASMRKPIADLTPGAADGPAGQGPAGADRRPARRRRRAAAGHRRAGRRDACPTACSTTSTAPSRSAPASGSPSPRTPSSGRWHAGAIVMQALPVTDPRRLPEAEEDWRRAMILLGTATDDELLDPALRPDDLLFRLFHEDGVRVFTPLAAAPRLRLRRAAGLEHAGELPAGRSGKHAAGGRRDHRHLPVLQPRLRLRPGPAERAPGAAETLTMAWRLAPVRPRSCCSRPPAPRPTPPIRRPSTRRSIRRSGSRSAASTSPSAATVSGRHGLHRAAPLGTAGTGCPDLPALAPGRGRRRRLRPGHGRGGDAGRAAPAPRRGVRAVDRSPTGRWLASSP